MGQVAVISYVNVVTPPRWLGSKARAPRTAIVSIKTKINLQ